MRFARRSVTGYYRPLGELSKYGIGLNDALGGATNWTKQVSTDPFSFSGTLHTLNNDAHGDFMYYTPSPVMTDQFSQMHYLGEHRDATDGPVPSMSGGLTVRHNNLGGWPAVKGYYWVAVLQTILTPTYSWHAGRYQQSGGTIAFTIMASDPAWTGPSGTIYIEAIGSGPVTVNVYINGSLLMTFTDSSGSVVLSGRPGIIGGVVATNGASYFDWNLWKGGPVNPVLPTVYQQRRGSGLYVGVR